MKQMFDLSNPNPDEEVKGHRGAALQPGSEPERLLSEVFFLNLNMHEKQKQGSTCVW